MLYGYGSKRTLLEEFLAFASQRGQRVIAVLDGAKPTASLRTLLDSVCKCMEIGPLISGSIIEQAKFVADRLTTPGVASAAEIIGPLETCVSESDVSDSDSDSDSKSDSDNETVKDKRVTLVDNDSWPRLLIGVHNIDGHSLRGENVQTAISLLAAATKIHIIASMDHVSGPLIMNQQQRVRGNWLWMDATTFQPYTAECVHVETVVKGKRDLTSGGLTFVLRSLTPNHRGILKVLADYQLGLGDSAAIPSEGSDDGDSDTETAAPSSSSAATKKKQSEAAKVLGIEFAKLLELCIEKLLVGTDSALRTHLVELKDHKLVASRRGVDRRDLLYIPLATSQIQQISELDTI